MSARPVRHRSRPGIATALALIALGAPAASAAPARFVGLQDWKPLTEEKFGRIDRANVDLWRNIFVWATVEAEKGTYRWTRYDRLFADAAANNVRIIPVLIGSPRWANWKPQLPPKDAATRRRFYQFAEAAVARYGPHGEFWRDKPYPASVRATDWEVWNEPNLRNYWGTVDPRA
jgi:polysaccharide biosynthesis protein PslG